MMNQCVSIATSGHWRPPSTGRAATWFLCLLLAVGPVARANNEPAGLLPVPVNAGSNGAEQAAADVGQLEPGKPIERELKGGESHSYQITLAADQYLHVVVEQRGVDVVAGLFGPDGKKLAEANRAKSRQGTESLTLIAQAPGNYRLKVRPAEKSAAPGRYEAKVAARRTPTAEERTLEEACRFSEESKELGQKGKYNEALPLEERALAIREKVLGPDHLSVAQSLRRPSPCTNALWR